MPRLAGLLLIVLGLAAMGCGGESSERVLKLGHSLPVTHPVHQGMAYMDERLQEISGGQMRIDIYSDGQLGPERVLLELLQIGSLSMTKVSASVMASFAPEYAVLELPYLFRDEAHRFAVLEGPVGRRILQGGSDYWLRGLAFYDAGSRSFYSCTDPIRTPEDLEGMKVRVMNSKNAIAMVQALGGAATPISFGELYTALQQGVVDGAENNAPSFYLTHHYELCALEDNEQEQWAEAAEEHQLPKHPLELEGYKSIGCVPCTHKWCEEDSREGRWAGQNKTECGLHT